MIGQVVESRPGPPVGSVLFLVLALALGMGTVVDKGKHRHAWAIGALLPLAIGVTLLACRPRPLAFELTEEGIEVQDPPQSIPYTSIEGLIAPGRPGDPDKPGPRRYPIQVIHDQGSFHIPKRLTVPSEDVFHFLLATFPASGSPWVNPLLHDYHDRQVETFGEDKVFSYRARSNLGQAAPNAGLWVSLVVIGVGLVWIGFGIGLGQEAWGGSGGILLLFGFLFAILFGTMGRRQGGVVKVKGWKEASLVVSPLGMALVQGDLQGEMRWDELKTLRFGSGPSGHFEINNQAGIRGIILGFEGAQVLIHDIYDRPLNLIYRQIKRYWGKK